MKDYSAIAVEYSSGFAQLATQIPGSTKAFGKLVSTSTEDGALSRKIKELIALSIAITVRCDGCIAAHSKSVLAAGATRQEVAEMIAVAMLMGGGPTTVYGVEAMRAYDQFAAAQVDTANSPLTKSSSRDSLSLGLAGEQTDGDGAADRPAR